MHSLGKPLEWDTPPRAKRDLRLHSDYLSNFDEPLPPPADSPAQVRPPSHPMFPLRGSRSCTRLEPCCMHARHKTAELAGCVLLVNLPLFNQRGGSPLQGHLEGPHLSQGHFVTQAEGSSQHTSIKSIETTI